MTARDDAAGRHHPDCPALFFTDHPERCRCEFMVMLDRDRAESTPAPAPAADGGEVVSVAIKAQNPDLETAWESIAWWERTCAYWQEQAQEGYRLRATLAQRDATARAEGAREALEAAARELPGFDAIRTHGDAAKWLRARATGGPQ